MLYSLVSDDAFLELFILQEGRGRAPLHKKQLKMPVRPNARRYRKRLSFRDGRSGPGPAEEHGHCPRSLI